MNTTQTHDDVEQPTYAILRAAVEEHLNNTGRESQVGNYKTALTTWLCALNMSEEDFVGEELSDAFDQKLLSYEEAQHKVHIKKSTYKSRVTYLRNIKKEVYDEKFASKLLPKKFPKRLTALIKKAGHTIKSFWRENSDLCSGSTLYKWCLGKKKPSSKSLLTIKKFEERLGVEEGTLSSVIDKVWGSGRRPSGLTSFGKKMQAAHKEPYGVWTSKLEFEWQGLFHLKTDTFCPKGKDRDSIWTRSEGKSKHPTADSVKDKLRLFFGFCCLPPNVDPYISGLGMRPDQMTLGLLTDERKVEKYIEFQKRRAANAKSDENETPEEEEIRKEGYYTDGTLTFISNVCSFLRPKKGYLYQSPGLAKELITDDSPRRAIAKEWQQRCVSTRERLFSIEKDLKKSGVEKGRNPEEAIQQIIDQDRPMWVLIDMVKKMQSIMEDLVGSPEERAEFYRNILLVALITLNPLRIRMFSIMRFDRHLRKKADGSWWLEFKKNEFKNRSALKKDYSVMVAPVLWELIERYKNEFRPHLAGADKCNFVFRQRARGRHRKDNVRAMAEASLSNLLRDLTYEFILGCPGFGSHAFRHIVATDHVKADRAYGLNNAARALHDKYETVETAYAHLTTSELFKPVNEHFTRAWTEVMEQEAKAA